MTTEIDAFFPRLLIEGLYKGEGRYSTFKVNAKGYFNVSMSKPNIFFIFSYLIKIDYCAFSLQKTFPSPIK